MRRTLTKAFHKATRSGAKAPQNTSSNLKSGTAPLSHMKIGSKWSYSTLEYPIDIQQRSDLGHYMMFYVNVMDVVRSGYGTYGGIGGKNRSKSSRHPGQKPSSNLNSPEQPLELTGARKALRHETGFSAAQESTNDGTVNSTFTPGSKPKVVGRKHHQGRLARTASWADKRTVRTTDSIVLYMPATIQTNTNVVYKGSEMGNLASSIATAAGDFYSKAQEIGYVDAAMDQVPNWLEMGIEDVQRAIAKGVSAIVGGDIASAVDKISNRAQNRYLESLFDSIGFRKFSYTYKFTPKSPEESLKVREIIRLFKFHMSPELPEDDLGRFFIPPAEWDIFYMFRGDENDFLNKITSCVLTNMDLNYANGRFQTFRALNHEQLRGAPPTEIEMKLDFMETRIITKKEVAEGY